MKIRSTEELLSLLEKQEGLSVEIKDGKVNMLISVRNEEYYLDGNINQLYNVGYYNPDNIDDEFVLNENEDREIFDKIDDVFVNIVEAKLDY
jgi:TFIIF-interacting CTD phosphatase-like protein